MTNPVPTSLPSTRVLSYVTNVSTPTRARTIAFIATLIISAITFVAGAGLLAALLIDCGDRAYWAFALGPVTTPSFLERLTAGLRVALQEQLPWFLALSFLAVAGLLLIFVALKVRRARPWACWIAWLFTWPVFAAALFLAAGCAGAALMEGFGIGSPAGKPAFHFFWIPALLCTLLAAFILDIFSLLLWIARNPITEKPPVPFLPLREQP